MIISPVPLSVTQLTGRQPGPRRVAMERKPHVRVRCRETRGAAAYIKAESELKDKLRFIKQR